MKGELPLQAIADALDSNSLPPVHTWKPQYESSVDIQIRKNGDWYYQESRIERPRMIRLFSTVLRVDQGKTYLVTPHEKLLIDVEDAPFTAVSLRVEHINDDPSLVFTTNVGESVVADSQHPIYMDARNSSHEPRPYVMVRDALHALILRPVYYQLAELAVVRYGKIGVESNNHFMPLAVEDSDL